MDPMGFGGDMKSDEFMEEFSEAVFSEGFLLLICTVLSAWFASVTLHTWKPFFGSTVYEWSYIYRSATG